MENKNKVVVNGSTKEILKLLKKGGLQISSGHKISGNLSKVKRNHAVAEVLAVMARCAVEFRPQALPNLRMDEWGNRLPNKPLFYTSRQLKRFADNDGKETIYTRLIV